MDVETELTLLRERVSALETIVHAQSAAGAPSAPVAAPDFAAPVQAPAPGPTFLPAGTPVAEFAPPVGPPTSGPGYAPPPSPAALSQQPPPPGHPAPFAGGYAAEKAKPAFDFGVESVLRWAGVALVSLAGIFLVSTAVSRGWIGPELQLMLAALCGFGLLGASTYLAENRRPWSLALGCGGAIVVIVSALATHEWLDLVGPGPAVVLAALAAIISIGVAVFTRIEGVALVASLAALLAPLDTLTSIGATTTLVWATGIIVASSALGLVQRWRSARLFTGWAGALVLLAYAVTETVEGVTQGIGLIGTALIALTLWGGSAYAVRLEESTDRDAGSPSNVDLKALDYRVVGLVPGWVWGAVSGIFNYGAEDAIGFVALGVAIAFVLVAAGSWTYDKVIATSTLLGALTLLAVGFAIILDGPALMVALAGQAITSYFVGRELDDRLVRLAGYLAMAAASLLALGELFDAFDDGGFESLGAALATGLIVGIWVGAAAAAHVRRDDVELPFDPVFVVAWIGVMLWVAAVLYGIPQGLGLISAAWAVLACGGLIVGLTNRLATVRTVAMLTLGATLLKLVSVDMAEIEVFWRVGLFFVVGMGLIALGLKVPSLMGASSEEEGPSAPPTNPAEVTGFTSHPPGGPQTF